MNLRKLTEDDLKWEVDFNQQTGNISRVTGILFGCIRIDAGSDEGRSVRQSKEHILIHAQQALELIAATIEEKYQVHKLYYVPCPHGLMLSECSFYNLG